MFVLLLILSLIAFLTRITIKWCMVRKYWAVRNIPHDSPHPIFGSLTFLQKQNPAIWVRELYKTFKTPYVGIWLFWRPALVINSPDIARRVLIKDAEVFRNRFLSSGKTDPIGSLNLFTVNDPTWSQVRRKTSVIFTASKLRGVHALVTSKAKQLIQRIHTDNEKKERINIRSLFVDYTTDVFGTAAFGVASDSVVTGDSPMRKVTRDFMKYSFWRGLAWSSIFFFPELVDVFRFSMFPKGTTDYFKQIFRSVVAERGGYTKEREVKDLLDVLIKMKRDAALRNEEMSEDLLVAQAVIFLFGGFDTTSSTIAFLISELAYQPEIQERLYNEVLQAKQRICDQEFEASDLAELRYLNAVIKETLRKYPTMGWLERIAAKDYEVDENLTIAAGTPVYVNAAGIQVDPEYYPDPYRFDPERFLPENEDKTRFTYMPFGEGPRSCIGKRFALVSMRYALSSIILNFDIQPCPLSPEPWNCEIEKRGLLLQPAEILSVRFVPRH